MIRHAATCHPAWAAHVVAALALGLAALVGWVVLAAGLGSGADRLAGMLPDARAAIGWVGNTTQRLAHALSLLALLAATGAGVMLMPWLARRSGWARRGGKAVSAVLSLGVVGLTAAWVLARPEAGWTTIAWGQYGIFMVPGRPEALAGLLGGVAVIGAGMLVARIAALRWLPHALLAAVLCLCLFLVVPGLVGPVRLDAVAYHELLPMEAHYGVLLGDRLQLTAGAPLVDVVEPRYGFLWPVLAAMAERATGPFTLGQNIRLVQMTQVLCLTVFALALLVQARGAMLGVAVALLLAAPWLSTAHMAVFHPNQAGFRFIGLALTLLALAVCARRPIPARGEPFLLGGVAGVALLVNYETGIAAGAGVATFLTLRHLPRYGWGGWLRVMAGAAAAFLLAHAAYWALAAIVLGQPPRPLAGLFWPLYSDNLEAALGLAAYFDLWMLFIACAAALMFVRTSMMARLRAPSAEAALLAGVGAILLVWVAYWASRPHWWNDWSYLFLFGPFVVAALRPGHLRQALAWTRRGLPPAWLLAIACGLGPAAWVSQAQILPAAAATAWAALAPAPADARLVSGVLMNTVTADRLTAKAAAVSAAAGTGRVAYISAHQFSIAVLSGQTMPFEVREMLYGIKTRAQFDGFVADVRAYAPAVILIDSEGPPHDLTPAQRRMFDALAAAFAPDYKFDGESNGWRVLRRTAPKP